MIEPVADIVRHHMLDTDDFVVFLSGRSDATRSDTQLWLNQYDLGAHDGLYMRKADDYRRDDIVKEELLDEVIDYFQMQPSFVFDDRPQVVRMWHRRGIFCFNVMQGFGEF